MAKGIQFDGRPVWAEISTSALKHNLRAIRRRVGRGRKILAIVKGNAYGHGAVEVSRVLERERVDLLGVTCTTEAIELRESGVRSPILLLSGTWQGEEPRVFRHKLTPAVTNVAQLRNLERAASRARLRRPLGFHLKVDTGMNRLGVMPEDIGKFLAALADCRRLKLEGTFTHFASSENFASGQTEEQERRFATVLERMRAAGCDPGISHLANSAAIASRPSTWADMVRPGAILYGYHQNYDPPEKRLAAEQALPLRLVLSLRARILMIRDVKRGEGVGYNARFTAERDSRIAILAAGYADGLVRHRHPGGPDAVGRRCVLLHGQCAPVVGIVSMDLAAVDVTGIPAARVGDVVTIYGTDGKRSLPVSDAARQMGTVTSDLLTSIGARVRRICVR